MIFYQQSNKQRKGGNGMIQKIKIAKEKNKLKLNLLKHANINLETRNNPELLRAVAELLKEIK